MLVGDKVLLRAVEREDVALLEQWERDAAEWPQVSLEPMVPQTSADGLKRYEDGESWRAGPKSVPFAIEAERRLVGHVALWGIDLHNRLGHLGIGLGPESRGKGYGSDACRVLLRYAFAERGLHRVQLEVLATNEPAIRAYRAAGFVEEGRTRESAWVHGRFVDELIMAVLAPGAG